MADAAAPDTLRQAEAIRTWREHPARMVRDLFGVTPDGWQENVLEAFPTKPRQAMKASKGVGKTSCLAWLAWNFLLTRPHPKIAATSISEDNLSDNLWTEMAKWQHQSPLLQAAFQWTKTRISLREYPETWWMAARTWPKTADKEQQALTLAGLHADFILFILDEAGGIPDAVMASAEAALSSCVEGHLVIAGNPTHREGPLWRACTTEARLWHVTEISGDPDDINRSKRVSVQWAKDQIEKYGRDNPWVLVNVFGKFPPGSINTLISPDEIEAAFKRCYREMDYIRSSKILGVDVARFGDDKSVMFPRQGIIMFPPAIWRNVDSHQGAGAVARKMLDWHADAAFVDDTGGFGAGWIDQLRALGHKPIGVGFANKAHDDGRYFNKRAEMYFDFVQWIKDGGQLPTCPELKAALTQTTYTFKGDRLILEPKDLIKVKLGYSPDEADAGALTFAYPVLPKQRPRGQGNVAATAYDPFGPSSGLGNAVQESYDPFRGLS